MSPRNAILITLFAGILVLFAFYFAYPSNTLSSQEKRFYAIEDQLDKALARNDKESVIRLADEYLTLADNFKDDWNYGNAIHRANEALGIVALRENDLEKAGQYLIKAGKTPGSPQLDTFGPKLELADALLKKGEKKVVVEYLRLVSRFWKLDGSDQCFPVLITRIERGEPVKLEGYLLLFGCQMFKS